MTDSTFPFAYRDFRLFWVARIFAMLAQSSMVLSIGWQVYDVARLTMSVKESAFRLGLIGFFQFLPVLLLTPISGLVADRVDRRLVACGSLMVQWLGAVLLAVLAFGGSVSLVVLYLVSTALGVFRAFYMPSMNALAPNLVPREVLPRAIATNAMAGRAGAILGPVLGGMAYAVGPGYAFGQAAVLLLVSVCCLIAIRIRMNAAERSTAHPFAQMREGLSYVFTNRLLLGTISLDLFAVLLGGATAILPAYARDILHVGPQGLGMLRASPAVGALTMAVWFAWRPIRNQVGGAMLVAVAIFGLGTVGFGLSRWLPLSILSLVVIGGADMVSVVIRQSLMQLHTPNEMRGRVGAISTLFISASNELGEAESGFLASLMGPVASVVFGGVGAVVVALAWSRMFPELRAARKFDVPPG
ncbi:MFS transporter [Novosphingobium terrae]|uniref:MFS transporter n=1 Tax=Novosphingobium terrae TaxID=2726189 RepID=UPI001980F955|nr:MFS transporter [Novosphingobium terrae]